jgi:hypothetical protein
LPRLYLSSSDLLVNIEEHHRKPFSNIVDPFHEPLAFAFYINPFVLSCIGLLGFFVKLFDECFISMIMLH